MLAIRTGRRTSSCLIRTTISAGQTFDDVPQAESSAAARRRYLLAGARYISTTSTGEERAASTPIPNHTFTLGSSAGIANRALKKSRNTAKASVAIHNAKKLARALRSARTEGTDISQGSPPDELTILSPRQDSLAPQDPNTTQATPLSYRNIDRSAPPALNDLEDLFSPGRLPTMVPVWYKDYPGRYDKVYTSVDNAFKLRQLRGFAKELKIHKAGSLAKHELIPKILSHWGWAKVEPKPVEKAEDERFFNLPAPELFLFLRNANAMNNFMTKHGLTFSSTSQGSDKGEADDTAKGLWVQGSTQNLVYVEKSIQGKRKAAKYTSVSANELHGFRASQGLLSTISNITGAYAEVLPGDRYRITALSDTAAARAKQLLHIAALRTRTLAPLRQFTSLVPSPTKKQEPIDFTLLPFQSPISNPLPWEFLGFASSSPMFRLGKVATWAVKPALAELSQREEDLGSGEVRVLGKGDGQSEVQSFRQLLVTSSAGDEVDGVSDERLKTRTTATFGHHLLCAEGSDPLTSPLPGSNSLTQAHDFLSTQPFPIIFAPSPTPAMIQYPLRSPSTYLLRLVYRQGEKTFTVTYAYPSTSSIGSEEEVKVEEKKELSWQEKLNQFLDQMEKEERERVKGVEEATFGRKVVSDEMGLEDSSAVAEGVAGEERSSLDGESTGQIGLGGDDLADGSSTPNGALGDVPESSSMLETQDTTMSQNATSEITDATAAAATTGDRQTPDDQVPAVEDNSTVDNGQIPGLTAELGTIHETDMLLPTRPIDLRLKSSSASPIPSTQIPEEITTFIQTLLTPTDTLTEIRAHKLPRPPGHISLLDSDNLETFELESYEELEITESKVESGDVVLRSVRATDKNLGLDRVISYTELEYEGGGPPPAFWSELANVSREVGPDAASLRPDNRLFF